MPPRWLIVAADALADLHAALTQGGVVQHLAGLKGPARNRLAR